MEMLENSPEKAAEAEMVLSCQAGNLEVFSQLYDCYIRKIYDFVYFKTHHRETAEDLTSKTFMKALENIASCDPRKGSFSSWLYRIARNTVIDHYRTHKSHSDIEDAWDIPSEENTLRDLENIEKFEEVKKYLQELKPDQREIVMMRIWNGMSYQEIAETVGKSEGNCKMIYSRAISKIKAEHLLAFLFLFFMKS